MMETQKELYLEGETSKHIPKYMIATFGAISGQKITNFSYINYVFLFTWIYHLNYIKFSGACSCYATAPIDVVKTRMQSLYAFKYVNSLDCVRKIWQSEGFWFFYKGSVARLCRNMIDVAFSFTIYDIITELLDHYWIMSAR